MTREELEGMQAINNRVLIRMDKIIQATVDIGVELTIDTDFYPWEHIITSGEVVSAPSQLIFRKRSPISGLTWDTAVHIRPGDRVIFDYFTALTCFGRKVNPVYVGDDEWWYAGGSYYILIPYSGLQYCYRSGTTLNGYVSIGVEATNLVGSRLEELGLASVTEAEDTSYGTVKAPYEMVTKYDHAEYGSSEVKVGDRVFFAKKKTLKWFAPPELEGTKLVQDRFIYAIC